MYPHKKYCLSISKHSLPFFSRCITCKHFFVFSSVCSPLNLAQTLYSPLSLIVTSYIFIIKWVWFHFLNSIFLFKQISVNGPEQVPSDSYCFMKANKDECAYMRDRQENLPHSHELIFCKIILRPLRICIL